jgi:hypothetical protein
MAPDIEKAVLMLRNEQIWSAVKDLVEDFEEKDEVCIATSASTICFEIFFSKYMQQKLSLLTLWVFHAGGGGCRVVHRLRFAQ